MAHPTHLLMLCLVATAALAQPKPEAPRLSVVLGSVGVAYAGSHKGELRIAFPASTAPGLQEWSGGKGYKATAPVHLEGDLVLFDEKGVLGELNDPQPANARFWCENDGGAQFRPELKLKVSQASFRRPASPRSRLQNLVAFVAVVPRQRPAGFKLEGVSWRTTSDERAFDGDLDGDGKPEAVIYVAQDEAGNCDGKPRNNLTVQLLGGGRYDALRCCGP